MPGTDFNLGEHLADPVTGVIACVCSADRVQTAEFLYDGDVLLEELAETTAVHHAGQYLAEDEGEINWTTPQIDAQLQQRELSKQAITPNRLYFYDSTQFHRPPEFSLDGGYRMFLRVNTPPANSAATR